MQYYQGLYYTHVSCRRTKLEELQDLLFSFNAFVNGVKISPLTQLCYLSPSRAKKLVGVGIKSDLIEKVEEGIYDKTEKGSECNFTWYAIRDKFKLGDIKDGDKVISKSVISSIFNVESIPLSQEMDESLNNASFYQSIPKYPPIGRLSPLLTYLTFLKICGTEPKPMNEVYEKLKKLKKLPYDHFQTYRDSAKIRKHIKIIYPDKKQKMLFRTGFGTGSLNVINWYTTQYKLVDVLPLSAQI